MTNKAYNISLMIIVLAVLAVLAFIIGFRLFYKFDFSGCGNTMSNIRNYGIIVGNDNYICYSDPDNYYNNYLYIYNKNDKSNKKITTNHTGCYLNLAGDWLYYIDGLPGKVYRYNLSKNVSQCINRRKITNMIIIDNNIYANYFKDNVKMICKMDLDGSNFSIILKDVSDNFDIYNNTIYYSNKKDNGYIYCCDLNGMNNRKLAEYNAVALEVYGDKILFIDKNTYIFYSVDMAGNDIRQMINEKVANYNIYDKGIVIYIGKSLYKTDFDLTKLEWLCNCEPYEIHIVGNTLIYPTNLEDEFFIMDLDKKEPCSIRQVY